MKINKNQNIFKTDKLLIQIIDKWNYIESEYD